MLEMPRNKPRLVWIRSAYLLKRFAVALLPRPFLSRVFLNTAWLSHRFAFETAGEIYRDDCHAFSGISESLLRANIRSTDRIVDVGCGHGRWAHFAAGIAKEVIGIDYNRDHIDAATRTAPSNCQFVVGDATKDLAGKFDVAILSHILEHLDDPVAFLGSLNTARIIIELPDFNANSLNHIRVKMGCPFYSDADHVREYTLDSLAELLAAAAFRVERIESRNGNLVAVASR